MLIHEGLTFSWTNIVQLAFLVKLRKNIYNSSFVKFQKNNLATFYNKNFIMNDVIFKQILTKPHFKPRRIDCWVSWHSNFKKRRKKCGRSKMRLSCFFLSLTKFSAHFSLKFTLRHILQSGQLQYFIIQPKIVIQQALEWITATGWEFLRAFAPLDDHILAQQYHIARQEIIIKKRNRKKKVFDHTTMWVANTSCQLISFINKLKKQEHWPHSNVSAQMSICSATEVLQKPSCNATATQK